MSPLSGRDVVLTLTDAEGRTARLSGSMTQAREAGGFIMRRSTYERILAGPPALKVWRVLYGHTWPSPVVHAGPPVMAVELRGEMLSVMP